MIKYKNLFDEKRWKDFTKEEKLEYQRITSKIRYHKNIKVRIARRQSQKKYIEKCIKNDSKYLEKTKEYCRKYSYKNYKKNKNKILKYQKTPNYLSYRKKYAKEYYKKNRSKLRCREIVSYYVRIGKLIKPKICSECKKPNTRIEAHHNNYAKPLEIIWLCPSCHGKLHRKNTLLDFI